MIAKIKKWECFCDESYYGLWCVRLKTEREFGQGFHIFNKIEAEMLCELLNKLDVYN
jgi:hypothetical protein